jgi:hypothetical protein
MITTDLGNNWFANQYDDGRMTIRSPERGQRIELSADSVERLRQIFIGAKPMTADDTFNITTGN